MAAAGLLQPSRLQCLVLSAEGQKVVSHDSHAIHCKLQLWWPKFISKLKGCLFLFETR